ncbi:MAG: PIG-L deacetylase family protein [Erysipelotrichaceae bacterium]
MAKYNRIIIFGGHPLDAELMGGPMAIRYTKQGARCTFVNTVNGRLEGNKYSEAEKQAYIDNLKKEIDTVAGSMGCDAKQFPYVSQSLPSIEEFSKIVEEYLLKEQADCVITHWRGTMHQRHQYTYDAVTRAVKRLRKKGVNINLFYGENCEDLVGFIPTVYLSMSEADVDKWFSALCNYSIFKGTVNDVPYQDYYKTMGKVRAIEVGGGGFVKAYMHAGLLDNE